MKVSELIDLLEELDSDAEVRLMCQPSYPIEHHVRGVVTKSELSSEVCNTGEVVYLVEGSQAGYGIKEAWELTNKRW